jgi:Restriction endonuclease NotI
MPIVSELFGWPLYSSEGRDDRKSALCPFMNKRCDGGGNRDMARLSLERDAGVRARFNPDVIRDGHVACAICSIDASGKQWIICPRRLLNFSDGQVATAHQNLLANLCKTAGFTFGKKVSVWQEVTISDRQHGKSFNYRLDYVLREQDPVTYVYGPPIIVEIMTCSTSGGNKRTGTDIATAFSKAMLADQGDKIESPNVNVRQVWSRMAGQMIVKSEAANKWGGKTIWVVQDLLIDYIRQNTGLDIDHFQSSTSGEVNILASNRQPGDSGILYAGPISGAKGMPDSFSDILRAPFIPEFSALEKKLTVSPNGHFIAP